MALTVSIRSPLISGICSESDPTPGADNPGDVTLSLAARPGLSLLRNWISLLSERMLYICTYLTSASMPFFYIVDAFFTAVAPEEASSRLVSYAAAEVIHHCRNPFHLPSNGPPTLSYTLLVSHLERHGSLCLNCLCNHSRRTK